MSEQRHLDSITRPPLWAIWVSAIRGDFSSPIGEFQARAAACWLRQGGERDKLQKPPCCCPSSAAGGEGGPGGHVGLGGQREVGHFLRGGQSLC